MDKNSYYQIARKGSLIVNHPGMITLKKLSLEAKNILDLGCGEGTRLNFLVSDHKKVLGVDISKIGINIAKKSFPHIPFKVADLKNLPINDNSFDLVYSAFVLEHLSCPEKMISEAFRIVSPGGYLVLIAPNFGAPNRISPPFKGSKFNKFIKGLLSDILMIFSKEDKLNWQHVEPFNIKNKYEIDWDTTIEPYIGTLILYLKSKGLKIEIANTCWSEELSNAKFFQKIFKFLGKIGIYPFWMWGPHLLVVAKNI